jgi:hypothetical protein
VRFVHEEGFLSLRYGVGPAHEKSGRHIVRNKRHRLPAPSSLVASSGPNAMSVLVRHSSSERGGQRYATNPPILFAGEEPVDRGGVRPGGRDGAVFEAGVDAEADFGAFLAGFHF